MAKQRKPKMPKVLSDQQVEELFATLDETGHVDPVLAGQEHARRRAKGVGLEVDPLSGKDPSGSNVSNVIARTAVLFVLITLAVILGAQVSCGVARRVSAGNLATQVSVESVASALRNGVEWGGGFTQFPTQFSVQEADENTGRIDVSVVDNTSTSELDAMASSYIQATAFATNALLNPKITTVVYRVSVHAGEDGQLLTDQFFGFLRPAGATQGFMTFIFTKATSANGGFNIHCTITGLDEKTTQRLRDKIAATPLDLLTGGDQAEADEAAEKDGAADDAGTADDTAAADSATDAATAGSTVTNQQQ